MSKHTPGLPLREGERVDCRVCGGDGYWSSADWQEPEAHRCPACSGTGKVIYRPLPRAALSKARGEG